MYPGDQLIIYAFDWSASQSVKQMLKTEMSTDILSHPAHIFIWELRKLFTKKKILARLAQGIIHPLFFLPLT